MINTVKNCWALTELCSFASEGWEQNGLYEFFRAKMRARRKKEQEKLNRWTSSSLAPLSFFCVCVFTTVLFLEVLWLKRELSDYIMYVMGCLLMKWDPNIYLFLLLLFTPSSGRGGGSSRSQSRSRGRSSSRSSSRSSKSSRSRSQSRSRSNSRSRSYSRSRLIHTQTHRDSCSLHFWGIAFNRITQISGRPTIIIFDL